MKCWILQYLSDDNPLTILLLWCTRTPTPTAPPTFSLFMVIISLLTFCWLLPFHCLWYLAVESWPIQTCKYEIHCFILNIIYTVWMLVVQYLFQIHTPQELWLQFTLNLSLARKVVLNCLKSSKSQNVQRWCHWKYHLSPQSGN